ncbi:MAG: hypothetical protein ACKVS6_16855 [Planctomycetota bacterium]
MTLALSTSASAFFIILSYFQGTPQDLDPGVPGDEGALRSQAFLAQIADTHQPKLVEALPQLLTNTPAAGFATLRRILRESRDTSSGTLLTIDADKGARLLSDLTNILRQRAASLTPSGIEQYLSDADPAAAAELSSSFTVNDFVTKASAYPRTAAATKAYLLIFQQFMERGDLAAARSAVRRLLSSNAGAPSERAEWWAVERHLAMQLSDFDDVSITDDELKQTVRVAGLDQTLHSAVQSLVLQKAPLSLPKLEDFRLRWRVKVPPQAKLNLSEPIERIAIDLGDRLLIQTVSELALLDPKTGQMIHRVSLDPAIFKKPAQDAEPLGASPEPDRKLVFLGKRRARPASDGRFIVATAGGATWLFERAGDTLQFRWARSGDRIIREDSTGTKIMEAAEKRKDSVDRFFCDGALMIGGRIFITSIQLSTDTFTFLHAFDPVTGEEIFQKSLTKGGAAGSSSERRFVGRVEAVIPQPLVYCGNRIIVATEMGVVISADPLDGEIEYALRIQRSSQPGAYEPSAPAAANGKIYISPGDSDYIYSLEPALSPAVPGSAPLPFAFDRAPQRRRDALFLRLVGAVGTRAFLYGREQQIRRTLTSFDFNPSTRIFDNLPMGPGEEPVGLPAILEKYIFVPTNHGITLYECEVPVRDVWQLPLPVDADTRLPLRGDEALGDLTILYDGLLSCGKDWIICYERSK